MKDPDGLAHWTPSELDNIIQNSKDIRVEEDYELGSGDDMRRAAEHSLREKGEPKKAEAVRHN